MTGWMQTDIFYRWVKQLISFTNCSKDRPVLLIFARHPTHVTRIKTIELARESRLILLALLSHCTHRLQASPHLLSQSGANASPRGVGGIYKPRGGGGSLQKNSSNTFLHGKFDNLNDFYAKLSVRKLCIGKIHSSGGSLNPPEFPLQPCQIFPPESNTHWMVYLTIT